MYLNFFLSDSDDNEQESEQVILHVMLCYACACMRTHARWNVKVITAQPHTLSRGFVGQNKSALYNNIFMSSIYLSISIHKVCHV